MSGFKHYATAAFFHALTTPFLVDGVSGHTLKRYESGKGRVVDVVHIY
jgi:hypothetical protein